MKRIRQVVLGVLLLSLGGVAAAGEAEAAELGGSRGSMLRQNGIAKESGYTFVETPAEVRTQVKVGELVPLGEGGEYELARVRYPYARPEVRQFIERLSAQYRSATGGRLVVTSLMRPASVQPSNASPLSVHPAGMAVDLRVPADGRARAWLESALLSLESRAVLDVTRERRPPHYHVAVFPERYGAYVEERLAAEAAAAAREAREGTLNATSSILLPAALLASVAPGSGPGAGAIAGRPAEERGRAVGAEDAARRPWLGAMLGFTLVCAAGAVSAVHSLAEALRQFIFSRSRGDTEPQR